MFYIKKYYFYYEIKLNNKGFSLKLKIHFYNNKKILLLNNYFIYFNYFINYIHKLIRLLTQILCNKIL